MRDKGSFWSGTGVVLSIVAGFLAGCSVTHSTMRGSIIAMLDNEAHICIGTSDGLNIGDTLTVYRTRQMGRSMLPYGPIRTSAEIERSFRYKKTKVGKVRVIQVFDQHFAAVEVLAGEVDYPDIVEKSQ